MIVQPGPVVDFLIANQNVKDPFNLDWIKVTKFFEDLFVLLFVLLPFSVLDCSLTKTKPNHDTSSILLCRPKGLLKTWGSRLCRPTKSSKSLGWVKGHAKTSCDFSIQLYIDSCWYDIHFLIFLMSGLLVEVAAYMMIVVINEDVGIVGLRWRREVLLLEKMIQRRSQFMNISLTGEKFLSSILLVFHVLMSGSQNDLLISQLR